MVDTKAPETPVVATTEVTEVAVAVAVTETPVSFTDRLKSLQADLATLAGLSKKLTLESRVLAKEYSKAKLVAPGDKKKKKREKRVVDPNAPKSGIQKPQKISAELAKFLGVTPDTLVSRTDSNGRINKYISGEGLKDPANGRHILVDKDTQGKLKVLLGDLSQEDKDGLTFFNIHKHLKHHFIKEPVPEGTEAPKKKVLGRKKAATETVAPATTPAVVKA
jgi:chromatin remodeling complex protein RSC6